MINPYLQDGFAPIEQEYTLTDLEVSGRIPDYLDGRYLRNGPNPIGEIDPAIYHWFVGDGMVHGVRIRDGKAEWYRNRYVRGPLTAKTLGEAPPHGRHVGPSGIGANTNVIGHAGRTLALIEGGISCYDLRRRRRPKRAGHPGCADDGHRREHPPTAPRPGGFPRQLGAERTVTNLRA
jgi:carotenoid cleavage dioxygenase